MDVANTESFSRLLQLSVSPVVLISGVGLLLLSVTNRLGRAILAAPANMAGKALCQPFVISAEETQARTRQWQ